ncbi:hypothetical protein LGT39_03460 [Demequina sp. TTPB684]|uniref:ion channel n=1 Tax=unclassified Demequina TaxID=2620311 RepID=UPI001CF5982B|nr:MULTISPECIES: ion channel [unclassified Demequina]MCB2411904.1 hypothetical protein [Demequina sp. TTPB684]UPU89364.1 ion channel [Demequina sp. TMPB413]
MDLMLLGGVVLIVVAIVDALWTTLWVDRAAGPVTSRTSSFAWHAALRLLRRRHGALSACGPVILIGTVVGWLTALWAGWVLVYASDPNSLVGAGDVDAPGWTGRMWYAGYAIFTMGNGDFLPREGAWQVISILPTATGMFLVTMAVTYLLSVVSAATQKRAFASAVHGVGHEGAEVALSGWDGNDLRSLDLNLSSLSTQLTALTEKYLSYPVLQYYHAARPDKSPAVAIAVLDDALMLMSLGVDPSARPSEPSLRAARSSVSTFLQTLDVSFIPKAAATPPAPSLDRLRTAGIPTVTDEEFADALAGFEEHRRRVLGLVRNDGWVWLPDRT